MPELWDIYDRHRNPTGSTIVRGMPMTAEQYHIVVQVWIRNHQGQWLISQRAPEKHLALKWEPPGGSVLAGEDSKTGALREVQEELGIALEPETGFLYASLRRDQPEWANPGFLDIWVFQHDCNIADVTLQPGETVDAKWVTTEELQDMIAADKFLPVARYAYIPAFLHQLT